MPRRILFVLCLCLPAFWIGGCTGGNVRLNDSRVPLELRRRNDTRADRFFHQSPPDADGCFVGLALSGGGSRSANFAAACMLQLEQRGILQKVDYISSVSGGSIPAALYCVSGREWNPRAVQKGLTHSFATDLIDQTFFLPWNWFALAFSDLNRSDLLARAFNRVLFDRNGRALTFADLRPDRPRLLLNATDFQSGRAFVFDNDTFDRLNSDLSRYPIANAVTASCAVPVVLHPVTLRDYSTAWPAWRHLIDGGVADNLGVITLVNTYTGQIDRARRDHRPDPYPRGAVFLVVDAQTRFSGDLSETNGIGWLEILRTAFHLTSTSLLSRVGSATLSDLIVRNAADATTARQLRDWIERLNRDGSVEMLDRAGHRVTVIYIALSQVIDLHELPSESFWRSVNGISTYFNISDAEAYDLYEAADLLMREKLDPALRKVAAFLNEPVQARP